MVYSDIFFWNETWNETSTAFRVSCFWTYITYLIQVVLNWIIQVSEGVQESSYPLSYCFVNVGLRSNKKSCKFLFSSSFLLLPRWMFLTLPTFAQMFVFWNFWLCQWCLLIEYAGKKFTKRWSSCAFWTREGILICIFFISSPLTKFTSSKISGVHHNAEVNYILLFIDIILCMHTFQPVVGVSIYTTGIFVLY